MIEMHRQSKSLIFNLHQQTSKSSCELHSLPQTWPNPTLAEFRNEKSGTA